MIDTSDGNYEISYNMFRNHDDVLMVNANAYFRDDQNNIVLLRSYSNYIAEMFDTISDSLIQQINNKYPKGGFWQGITMSLVLRINQDNEIEEQIWYENDDTIPIRLWKMDNEYILNEIEKQNDKN